MKKIWKKYEKYQFRLKSEIKIVNSRQIVIWNN